MVSSQKVGCVKAGISKNSMSPVNNVLFVPPSVKIPPGSSSAAWEFVIWRVKKKDISGCASWFALMSACQKGTDCVDASASNAKPIIPDESPSSKPSDSVVATSIVCAVLVNPPMETVSCASCPDTWPLPYRIVT